MSIEVADVDQYVFDMELRMPFHFANTTITDIPHLFLTVELDVGNETHTGVAAEEGGRSE
ncbi:hypothetical protein BRC70_07025 [Halobacteriales archaeon QH_6_68_27]|nr:MAG: hypothetical protein BRC70_07025 [Halobacteriales archaeon QH_6_68_27]